MINLVQKARIRKNKANKFARALLSSIAGMVRDSKKNFTEFGELYYKVFRKYFT